MDRAPEICALSPDDVACARGTRRLLLLAFGWASVGLAVAGAVLPLLPTTPFLLLAAWAFARSSPRLRHWMETHPRFGPPLRDWREQGAIAPRAKRAAFAALAVSWVTTMVLVGGAVAIAAGVPMLAASLFIATRPAPDGSRRS